MAIFAMANWHGAAAQDKKLSQQQLSLLSPFPTSKTIDKAEVKATTKSIWRYQSEVDPHGDQLISTLIFSKTGSKLSFFSSLISGRMAAPEGEGTWIKNNHFRYSDSFGNIGLVTIKTFSENQIEVRFQITEVKDPRTLMHYQTQRYEKQPQAISKSE